MKKCRQFVIVLATSITFALPTCLQEIRDVVQPPPDDCIIGVGDTDITLPCGWID